ncbi:MAG: hypothetical protein DI635_04120 [Pseudoxanthomonas suwonensis]|nr:MAG: hypothetical protein DI635_04120 [Pseudoxanthomonas suwonensis]
MVGHARRFRRCLVTAEQFRDARVFAGLSRDDAADLLGISKRTVGHWETAKARPSYAAFKLLRLYRHGDLLHPDWSEYRIARNGALVTPEGRSFFAHEIGWLSLLVQRARLSSELAKRLREGGTVRPANAPGGAEPGVPARPTPLRCMPLDEPPHHRLYSARFFLPRGSTLQWGDFSPLGAVDKTGRGDFSPLGWGNRQIDRTACPVGPNSNTGQKLAKGVA